MSEKLAQFTEMTEGSAEDYRIIFEANRQHGANLPDRILKHLDL